MDGAQICLNSTVTPIVNKLVVGLISDQLISEKQYRLIGISAKSHINASLV